MNSEVLVTTCLIILARIADVSLGTVRTVAVVNGRKGMALGLGFFEVLIWVVAVSKVVTNLDAPIYALAYATGYALGNYLGILIEEALAFGEQVLRVFTRQGDLVALTLRQEGYTVTSIQGEGLEGPIHLLVVQTARKGMVALVDKVIQLDPGCFYVVDDVRLASNARYRQQHRPSGPGTHWGLPIPGNWWPGRPSVTRQV